MSVSAGRASWHQRFHWMVFLVCTSVILDLHKLWSCIPDHPKAPAAFTSCCVIPMDVTCGFPLGPCSVSPAEELPFQDGSVDVLTSFTAAHWFDIERFMREAERVLRPGGCVAISTYTVDMSLRYGDCSEKLTQIFREVSWQNLSLGEMGGFGCREEGMGLRGCDKRNPRAEWGEGMGKCRDKAEAGFRDLHTRLGS